ncbi:hypothetical protein [Actinoplanes sp. NPDC023714]|uniref:SCO7613 C-terminal domain-containing membrane protein n=1 Tax=Actinoplanes sp. NPDC023714 TaxID=3154322 RepID=UPI0033F9B092
MTSAPSSYPCPHCGTVASAVTGCPGCGRAPDADALEVMRLDAELSTLRGDLDRARAEVTSLQQRITDTTTRRNAVAFRVTSSVSAAQSAQSAPAPSPSPPLSAPPAPEPRLSTLTVQNVLFALGGLLLIVAAAVFTAVAWAQVGVTGRAAILATATAAVLAVPPFAKRRGLTSAAETLAAVGLLMILLDGYAAWAVDLLQIQGQDPQRYAAAVCAVTAAVAFGYARLTGLRGPRIAALLVGQPVLPLLAASAGAGPIAWSLTLTGVLALNLAVLHRRRFAPAGLALVAYACGATAAAVSAAIAVANLSTAATATGAALAGGALVLVTAVATAGTVLARNRQAQTAAAGLLALAVALTAGAWSLRLGTDPRHWREVDPGVLRLAVVALVIAVLAAVLRPRLPEPVGRGPWAAALLVTAVPALGAAGAVLLAAGASVEAALPVFGASPGERVGGPGWTFLAATVAVLCSYAILLHRRHRTDLALTALAGTALLAPAAFRLPWWTAVIMGLTAAAGAIALATRRRILGLTLSALLAGHAVIIALGDPAVGAGAFAAVALIGFAGAYLVRPFGATLVTVALLAVPQVVWLTLFALDVSPTWQVRAQLIVAVAMVAAARAVPWYRSQVSAVALLLCAAVPVLALVSEDPVALYAAAALLLVTLSAVTWFAVAAVVPVIVLVYAAAPELSAVLLEPYAAVESFWSGDVPEAATARWSTLMALLIVAGAAAVAGHRSAGGRAAAWAAAPVVAVVVPVAFAVAGAPWPSAVLAGLVAGLLGLVAVAVVPSPAGWTAVVFVPLVTAGLAGTTPVQGAMVAGFALVTVAAAVCGAAGRVRIGRVAGWVGASVATVVVAYTSSQISDLGPGAGPLSVLAAAAVAAALESVLATRRPREAPAVAAVAHASALVALLIAGTLGRAALIATLWALVLGLRALHPGPERFRYTIAAAGAALLGWWLFLGARDVATPEIYTLPAAATALAAGRLARHRRPGLPSWTAYGPALAAAFLPTLAVIGGDGPEYLRRLLLGLAGLAVLLAGARARLQAPVVTGGIVLVLTALHELFRVWDLVPRWVPLAVGGLLLVGTATTMEQRRRDLSRLRSAVGRMS